MKMLTRRIEEQRVKRNRELRKLSNDGIKIYNTTNAQRCNPYAGDTTTLPFKRDGKTDKGGWTEDEVLESVLNPNRRFHVKRSTETLAPVLVCDEVKNYWRNRIHNSVLNNAKAKSKCE